MHKRDDAAEQREWRERRSDGDAEVISRKLAPDFLSGF